MPVAEKSAMRAGAQRAEGLRTFFAPRSVAIVGASDDTQKYGGRVMQKMLDFGFPGQIYPVNRRRDRVLGHVAHPSVAEIPEPPDHVGLALPSHLILPALEDCAAAGVPFATIFTSGFGEMGTDEGRAQQERITALARQSGMRIMGPNCNGLVSFVHDFALTTTGALDGPRLRAGDIGIVAQSGGLGQANVMNRALESGLRISHQVSCGNQADLDVMDFVEFMVLDPDTSVILMVVESIGDGARLRAVAEAAARAEKPIVILKLGRSEAGRAAAASHTGALTGSDEVHSAAFEQFGLIRVDDCDQLVERAIFLRQRRWPRSYRAAAVAASGGHGVLLADLGGTLGVEWAEFGGPTCEKLGNILPDYVQMSNPADLTTAATSVTGMFSGALRAIADDPAVDYVIPLFTINKASDIEEGAAVVREVKKPAAILWTGKCTDRPELTAATLVEQGVPVLRNALSCLKSVRATMDYASYLERFGAGRASERPAPVDVARVTRLLDGPGPAALSEADSRAVLAAYGFPELSGGLARTADEAAALARDLDGPAVLKIASADILHKTEAAGVRLNLSGEAVVRAAHDELLRSARAHLPDATIDGVLVQEMVPRGVELVLGGTQDATFGPIVSVGLGGVHVEVLQDIVHRIAPVDREEARRMLDALRGRRILDGMRGAGPADVDAVVDLIVRLSWLMHDFGDNIAELDINPLVALGKGQGARVLDALVIRRTDHAG